MGRSKGKKKKEQLQQAQNDIYGERRERVAQKSRRRKRRRVEVFGDGGRKGEVFLGAENIDKKESFRS